MSLEGEGANGIGTLGSLIINTGFALLFPVVGGRGPIGGGHHPHPQPGGIGAVASPAFFCYMMASFRASGCLSTGIFLCALSRGHSAIFRALAAISGNFTRGRVGGGRCNVGIAHSKCISFVSALCRITDSALCIRVCPVGHSRIVVLQGLGFRASGAAVVSVSTDSLRRLCALVLRGPSVEVRVANRASGMNGQHCGGGLSRNHTGTIFSRVIHQNVTPSQVR